MAECSISTSDLEVTRGPAVDNRLPEVNSNVRDDIDKEATLADSLDDAEGYVSSVMGTQPIVPVLRTPIPVLPSRRKRHLSLPAVSGTDHKKIRSDKNDTSEVDENCSAVVHNIEEDTGDGRDTTGKSEKQRVVVKARRNLMTESDCKKAPAQASRDKSDTEKESAKNKGKTNSKARRRRRKSKDIDSETITVVADVHNEGDSSNSLHVMFTEANETIAGKDLVNVMNRFADEMTKINRNMEQMWGDVNKKMDKMAIDIEKNLSSKLINCIDKRVNTEATKIKKDIGNRIDNLRDDFYQEVKGLQEQIDEMPNKSNYEDTDKNLNLCIRNLPQTERENVDGKVCDLFREGLRLRDISFRKAIKKDRNDSKPGVIIVTCETMEDKTRIMRVKKELKNSRKYDKVYIHNDQSVETRVNNNNLKVLISALGVSGVKLRGSRLVMEEDDSHTSRDRSNTDGNSYGRNHSERSNQSGYSSGYRFRNEQRSRDRENEERHDRQGERGRDRRDDRWDDRRYNRRDERDDRGDFYYRSSSGARNGNTRTYESSNVHQGGRWDSSERNGQEGRFNFPRRRGDRSESGTRRDRNSQ